MIENNAVQSWLKDLSKTHHQRLMEQQQTLSFYSKRKAIEYSVKGTITASLAVGLFCGGPALLIIGGASVMLGLTSCVLNLFKPADFIDIKPYVANDSPEIVKDDAEITRYQQQLTLEKNHYFFAQQADAAKSLQWQLGLSLIGTFIIFSIVNVNMTLLVGLAILLCFAAGAYQAHEDAPDYVEDSTLLNTFIR